jgi:hypothetical protein
MYSGPIMIVDVPGWQLLSYGNGAAYDWRNLAKGRTVWLQGDDAFRFRSDFEALEENRPTTDTGAILAYMWSWGYDEISEVTQ